MNELNDPRVGMIIISPAHIGGAEKRYVNAFRYLHASGYPIRLAINEAPYNTLVAAGLLETGQEGVDIFRIPGYWPVHNDTGENVGNGSDMPERPVVVRKPGPVRRCASVFKLYAVFSFIWLKVYRWKRKYGLKVLHGVFQGVYALTPFYLFGKTGTVVAYNDSSFKLLDTDWLRWFIGYRLGLRRATKIDYLSDFIADGVHRRGYRVDASRACVSPCSFIDYTRCRSEPERENLVVFCGRFIPFKNPLLFVEAAALVNKRLPGTRFMMLGEGPLNVDIAARIDALSMSANIAVRHLPDPVDILKHSLIFVSLQQTNNYPSQSLLEAMACGNAVVATDVGETRKLVDTSNGVLVAGDVSGIADGICALLQDVSRCRAMGMAGREKVMSEHTLERFSGYICDVYSRAAATVKSGGAMQNGRGGAPE